MSNWVLIAHSLKSFLRVDARDGGVRLGEFSLDITCKIADFPAKMLKFYMRPLILKAIEWS